MNPSAREEGEVADTDTSKRAGGGKSRRAAPAEGAGQRNLNAEGAEVSTFELAAAAPQTGVSTACLELRNGVVSFVIEVNVDPNTYPFVVSGGTIKSGICGAPWNVTGGFLGTNLRLDATRQGSGSCANTIIIVGEWQDPSSWRGTYGFDGQSSSFKHTTLFRSWSACP